ncbi:uncharacterized protein At1g26090, chloroplastic isoform X2 [Diospyros lotus]|uniref:uncharacterized protein At1g26090, chloroplastic isoform X2 n=1 Tax=Diospyros lotus TaxID=55363 RepID=UPI00225025A3|nr:uncharacterized protein At1g26090, chloroplastic isoform X2 [Diospyros lotus]
MAYTTPLLFPSSPSYSSLSIASNNSLKLARRAARVLIMAAASSDADVPPNKTTKLVTFLGKGGSGKTTSAVFAAQMLLEPLKRLKEADARLNMTQGVLEGVVGEELGVLPGMDTIFSALALENLVGFLRNMSQMNRDRDKFDIIVYDGVSTEETIRMIGATSKARLYLKYLRHLSERTDLGRLAGPSLLRLADEAISLSSRGSNLNGKLSTEIWDDLELTLERGSSVFVEQSRFGCYLVMDPENPVSVNAALRYWGCAIQAGAQVSGALGIVSPNSSVESTETVKNNFSPLPYCPIPPPLLGSPPDWNEIMLYKISEDARELLSLKRTNSNLIVPSVQFNVAKKTVNLFMPGFDKSEIKLYQFRGGSELLVEAGDQRRIIRLPSQIQGKVAGAKFSDRSLVITLR